MKRNLNETTKAQLFTSYLGDRRKVRDAIHKHCNRTVKFPMGTGCVRCGTEEGLERAHRLDVMQWPDDATLAQINAPESIIPLCGSCHALYDHREPEKRRMFREIVSLLEANGGIWTSRMSRLDANIKRCLSDKERQRLRELQST